MNSTAEATGAAQVRRSAFGTTNEFDVMLLVEQLPLRALPPLIRAATVRLEESIEPTQTGKPVGRELIPIDEAAELIGVSPRLLREMIADGRLRHRIEVHRIARRVLLDWPALMARVRSGAL